MIWDMDTIRKVSGLWMQLDIDATVLDGARDDVLEATRSRLANAIADEARTFGVDAHPGDVGFSETPRAPERGFGVTVRAGWSPSTTEIELLGGPADGQIVNLPSPYGRYHVPVTPGWTNVQHVEEYPSPDIPTIDYELAGWNEQARRWVFR